MKLKKEDITFGCLKCGECCRVDGYVYLKWGEGRKIAGYLQISYAEFKKKYTRFLLMQGRVIETDADGCAFLIDGRCIIYPVRPSQCVTFPYWKHVLESDEELKHIQGYCKGVKKK